MIIAGFQVIPLRISMGANYDEIYVRTVDGRLFTACLDEKGFPVGKDPWTEIAGPTDKKRRARPAKPSPILKGMRVKRKLRKPRMRKAKP